MGEILVGIAGVYGKNNLGDEALLKAVIADVQAVRPDSRFIVFCSDPAEVMTQHKVNAVSRKPFKTFFNKVGLIRQMYVFVVGGGTLLYEQGGWCKNINAILAFYFWPVLARLFGVKTVAYGQGLGPINTISMRLGVRLLPVVFDLITLRDAQSSSYIKSATNCYITSDPVAASKLFYKDNISCSARTKSANLLLAFRFPQAGDRELVGQWVKSVSEFVIRKQCKIILFPTQLSKFYFEDELLLDELSQLLISYGVKKEYIQKANWTTIEEGVEYLQDAHVVISNRLHALILAVKAGVPCVGLGGKDKIFGCLSMIGIEKPIYFLQQEKVTPELMGKILTDAWDISQTDRERIRERLLMWTKHEPTNIQCLKEILENKA